MSEKRAQGCLIAALIWCVILGVLGAAYKFMVHPYLAKKLAAETGSSSVYQHEITLAADSFSGYCILRSAAVRDALRAQQIKLTIEDDKADYAARLEALRSGRVQMAVFTIDSLIAAGAKAGEFPGSIVLVIDETKGGDAIVSFRQSVGNLQALNHPDARLVLTPASPSEFLARVVLAHFNLPDLPAQWSVAADGAGAVFRMFQSARPDERRAYVLWEPYVSRALQNPQVHVLFDSSKLKGYVVDVLVAQRQFLRDRPAMVKAVVEAYLRATYTHSQQTGGLVNLVREDARSTGAESLDDAQAQKVVQGIQWKNTLENYAHFGLEPDKSGGLQLIEDMIGNIVEVLVKTKALPADPLAGRHHELFYNAILAELKSANFHPGRALNLVPDLASGDVEGESVRTNEPLAALTPDQWNRLSPVGELRIEPIVFVRGSARISTQSERDLQSLAKRLESFPMFYLRIIGQTRAEGDPEANRVLAQARADAVAELLRSLGVAQNRVRTEANPSASKSGEAQAVIFEVGQVPY